MKLAWCRGRSAAAVMMPVAVAVLVAACGSSGHSPAAAAPASKPSPAKATNPAPAAAVVSSASSCSVVTQSEASAALGQPVRAPLLGKATVEGGVACVFYGPDVSPGTSVLQGDAYVRITVGIPDNVSVEETLARDALARM